MRFPFKTSRRHLKFIATALVVVLTAGQGLAKTRLPKAPPSPPSPASPWTVSTSGETSAADSIRSELTFPHIRPIQPWLVSLPAYSPMASRHRRCHRSRAACSVAARPATIGKPVQTGWWGFETDLQWAGIKRTDNQLLAPQFFDAATWAAGKRVDRPNLFSSTSAHNP
jgi:hypothetical protein